MQGNSKIVTGSGVDERDQIVALVGKYRQSVWRQPIREHNRAAYQALAPLVEAAMREERPVVFDSGCGTGLSSVQLAEKRHPEALVVGLDRSADRLTRNDKASMPKNCHLFRADCEDIWRLMAVDGLQIDCHYFLYPNPYPKYSQLQRRWYGHPVFPAMLDISKRIVCRSNWQQYLHGMSVALGYCGWAGDGISLVNSGAQAVSPFEKKYLASGQACYHGIWHKK